MKRICRIAWAIVIIVVVLLVVLTGASFYMLDYSLSPDATRENADLSYRQLYEDYPETAAWVDSLRRKDALRDTPTMFIKVAGKRRSSFMAGATRQSNTSFLDRCTNANWAITL